MNHSQWNQECVFRKQIGSILISWLKTQSHEKAISYSNFDKLTVTQCLLLFTPPWGGIAYNVLSISYAYYIFMLFWLYPVLHNVLFHITLTVIVTLSHYYRPPEHSTKVLFIIGKPMSFPASMPLWFAFNRSKLIWLNEMSLW